MHSLFRTCLLDQHFTGTLAAASLADGADAPHVRFFAACRAVVREAFVDGGHATPAVVELIAFTLRFLGVNFFRLMGFEPLGQIALQDVQPAGVFWAEKSFVVLIQLVQLFDCFQSLGFDCV